MTASVLAAALFWILQGFRPYPGSLVLKLLPLLLLLPPLWQARQLIAARWVTAALCIHMVGDAVLEWDRQRLLLAIGPFLIGHLLLAMAWYGLQQRTHQAARLRHIGIVLFAACMLALLLPKLQGTLLYAVPLYVTALLTMAWLAQTAGHRLIAWGALSYVLSDALIAYSGLVARIPGELYLTWPTYYLAQLGMISGLLIQLERQKSAR